MRIWAIFFAFIACMLFLSYEMQEPAWAPEIHTVGYRSQVVDDTSNAKKEITLGGKTIACKTPSGYADIVINNKQQSEGSSAPGADVLEMNMRMLKRLEPVVQWFVFYHECGHLSYVDEDAHEKDADNFAIRTGVEQGWLTQKDFQAICDSWEDAPADDEGHPSGAWRCNNLKEKFAQYTAEKEAAKPKPPVVEKWSIWNWLSKR